LTHASTIQEPLVLAVEDAKDFVSESRRDLDATSDTTCHKCPSGTIQYPGTHRCFARKWSGFLCNLDPATDPAKHHANDPKCVCSGPIFDSSAAEGQCMSGNYDVGTVLRQKAHTIHMELSMPTSFNSQSRQWILNLGQWNTGAHHWIWNSNSQIQFGRWNGEQISTFDIRVCNSLTMVVEPSTQMKLFCKGQLVGTHQGSVPFDVQNANLAVASNPQEQGFTGCVKQVKIWSRALTYSEVQQQVSTDTDTTCRTCPSGTIQYPGTHRCFARKWSGFLCNLDPATDPAKHHANDRKCVCSAFTSSTTQTPTSNPTRTPTREPTDSPTKMPTSSPTRNPTASPTSDCQSSFLSYNGKCYGTVDWDLKPEPVRFDTPVSSSADNCDIEEWHEIPDGCNLAPAQSDITQNVVGKHEFGTYLLILANGGAYQNPTYGATAGQRHLSHSFLQMGPTARHYKTKCCGCKLLLQCDLGFGIETSPTANPIVDSIFDVSSASGQCMSGDYDVGTVLGQQAHTIHVELDMPTSFNTQGRQWILNLGQWNTGANHWIWNSNEMIQFGRWNGEQIQNVNILSCDSLTLVVEPFTGMRLFCNGQRVGMYRGGVPFDIQNANLAIASNPWEQGFTGCVKQVKIWNTALADCDVQQISGTGRRSLTGRLMDMNLKVEN
jgi:hypothetical protein